MPQTQRPLFREHALQEYMQRTEKDILPRSVRPPTMLFIWLLLVVTLALLSLAWWAEIPTFVQGNGIVLLPTTAQPERRMVLAFFPVETQAAIQQDLMAKLQLSSSQIIQLPVTHVLADVQSPEAIRRMYQLDAATGALITQPQVVAEIQLPIMNARYAESEIAVSVQSGTERVISLLPGFAQLTGE